MKTVVIRVGKPKDEKFLVELFLDDGSVSWDETPYAMGSILKGLRLKTPVFDPFSPGTPLDEASVKKFFSGPFDAERFKAIGRYLYRLLFQDDDITEKWDDLKTRCPGERPGSEGLRTILEIQPSNLRALPWELMGENLSLFLDTANPFARGRIDFNTDRPKQMWPLRALVIVGSKKDDPTIDAELEVESIAGALRAISRTVEVDIMRRRLKSDVVKQYENLQPHIIHFIGHGGVTHGKPYLRLFDDNNNPQDWTVDEIANLGNTWRASFAFINACRSGDIIGVEDTWGIADAFINAGIPAVLGMLGDIKEEAAQTFAAGIYQALAQNQPLDEAVAKARFDVSNCKNTGLGTKQWALASLFLSVPPQKVMEFDYKIEERSRRLIHEDPEFGQLQAFVDRLDHRLTISNSIDPRKENAVNKSLFVVSGRAKVGKTVMVKLCLECWAMRGRRISWVDLNKGESSGTLDVLRSIRDGDPSLNSLLSPSLDQGGAFSQFNWEMERVLNPKAIKLDEFTVPANYKETNKSRQKTVWQGSPDSLTLIFSRFRDALQKTAADAPLIIVLDNIKISPDDFNQVLIPHLILPIKRGDVKNVKLILVLPLHHSYNMTQLGHYESVAVSNFRKEDFVPLALEFLRYKELQRRDVYNVVKVLDESEVKGDWEPGYLNTVLAVFRRPGQQ